MNELSRRHFITAALGSAGLLALPSGVLRAAEPPRRRHASRVLIINLGGGVRSSAAFIASDKRQFNPWGRMNGLALPLGKVLASRVTPADVYFDETDSRRRGRGRRRRRRSAQTLSLPALPAIASEFSVVGTWDPSRGDHVRSERVAHTGAASQQAPGILVRVLGASQEGESGAQPLLPAFDLGEPSSASYTPQGFEDGATVQVDDPSQLPRRDDNRRFGTDQTAAGFLPRVSARDVLDRAMLDGMGPGGRAAVLAHTQQRRLADELSSKLDHRAVRFADGFDEEAALGTLRVDGKELELTNALLRGIMEPDLGYSEVADRVVLAVRLLQLGSPAVSVTLTGFDTHSGEDDVAPRLYGQVGGLWSALHFVLAHLDDPEVDGATMLDRTLVVTNSEFGRDPGMPRTGFNGGGGSDHGSQPSTFYVGHAVMGGGVVPGRFHGRVDTNTFDARRSRERYTPVDLLATIPYALGLDSHRFGFVDARPISALWEV